MIPFARKAVLLHVSRINFFRNREKAQIEGTEENPNQTIWNFSAQVLTNLEEATLKFGLKHGIAKRPDEDDILASAEAVWHQIQTKGRILIPKTGQEPVTSHGLQLDQHRGEAIFSR